MARVAFWLAAATLAWTHVAFPVVVLLRARLRPSPVRSRPEFPGVSVIIAAHNAEAHIGDRLANLATQDYPAEAIEIVLASDGSTDGTVAEASRHHQVVVLDLARVGKIAALNAAVAASRNPILVFTDANTTFEPDAIRKLVMPFADPAVGGVAGDQRYLAGKDAAGERGHWALDRLLKAAESAAGSTISATGAIYAIRREMYEPVPPGVTDDFFISTGVIANGRRLVFTPHARAWEPVARGGPHEYRRKVRIMSQGFLALWLRRPLLHPGRHGFYAVQLLTHKLLRRLSAIPLLMIALALPFLARRGWTWRLGLAAEAVVSALAGVGWFAPRRFAENRIVAIATFLWTSNLAALHALVNVARGERIDRWSPTHEGSREGSSADGTGARS